MDKIVRTERENEGLRTRNCVIGIDPGVTGASAVYDLIEDRLITVQSLPVIKLIKGRKTSNVIDVRSLSLRLIEQVAEYGVAGIAIEHVHSSPQMGVKSAFNFGHTLGTIVAVAEMIHPNVAMVPPSLWKPRMGVTSDKKLTVERARKIFGKSPWLVKDTCHDLAEAALIARFAAKDVFNITAEVDPLS